jgi:hypothetical protein
MPFHHCGHINFMLMVEGTHVCKKLGFFLCLISV